MITDHKDFLEQLNVIKQGITIPAYDISKIMDSEEYNNYYADIEKSLNDLTGIIRSLEDCNQYMVTYVNDIVDKKYKELSDKLIALENNYSLYQNKILFLILQISTIQKLFTTEMALRYLKSIMSFNKKAK